MPLLVVDVQCGFVNPFTAHIPGRVARLIESGEHAPVLFTRFVNTPDSPYRRLLRWHASAEPPETELAPELRPFARAGSVFAKHGLAGVPPELSDHLREQGIQQVAVVGI